ncbi:hypothetical protein CMUST_15870 (plasmid) [Corynebacterium mustelae]|uniref:Uncharacterized protein n=1 Tax=Corynebacterium mustelae TaxID=571915 RepID=A0A0G3H8G3_9CORY|nr:hypothetical protein [Corynebacterium mustelae]AKK05212.1 hypothetical protein CMUST_04350 [Corynebacterium mustelae]AKK07462.1 hypothetical protein CMUST_15870 [Corynebacterium mustelae]
MTPTTQIQDFLNAAARVKAGLTDMYIALGAIETVALDWAEASGNLGEYNTPPAPEPVVTQAPEPTQTTVPAQPDPTPENTPQPAQTTLPADVPAEVEKPTPEPTPTAPELTFEDVRTRLVDIAKQGHADAVKNMLTNLGVSKLSDIPPERYPEVMALADGIIQ